MADSVASWQKLTQIGAKHGQSLNTQQKHSADGIQDWVTFCCCSKHVQYFVTLRGCHGMAFIGVSNQSQRNLPEGVASDVVFWEIDTVAYDACATWCTVSFKLRVPTCILCNFEPIKFCKIDGSWWSKLNMVHQCSSFMASKSHIWIHLASGLLGGLLRAPPQSVQKEVAQRQPSVVKNVDNGW